MQSKSLKVLIASADPALTARAGEALKSSWDFLIIKQAANAKGAVQAFKADRPDAVVLDLKLPGEGLASMKEMREGDPVLPIVVLAGRGEIHAAVETIKCGATDIILKPIDKKKLLAAVQQALSSPGHCKLDGLPDGFKALTSREREVLGLTVEGKSCTEIARLFSISHRTVEAHRDAVLKKLGVRNKAELIRFAMVHGILPAKTAT